jgi:hypothetical protein
MNSHGTQSTFKVKYSPQYEIVRTLIGQFTVKDITYKSIECHFGNTTFLFRSKFKLTLSSLGSTAGRATIWRPAQQVIRACKRHACFLGFMLVSLRCGLVVAEQYLCCSKVIPNGLAVG